MPPLTKTALAQRFNLNKHNILVSLPFPNSQSTLNQLIDGIALLLQADVLTNELGADRYQVTMRLDDVDFVVCAEWLCESIWIESRYQSAKALSELYQILLTRLTA